MNRPRDLDAATRGVALAEALVALTLAGVLLAAVTVALVGVGRLVAAQTGIATAAETQRLTRHVLVSELAPLLPPEAQAAGDSLSLRAMRGLGVVCGTTSDGGLVRYEGHRAPDPAKDSVVVIGAAESVLRLRSAAAVGHACPGADPPSGYRVDVGVPLLSGSLLLFFERGQYFLADGAFRYRRGAAGRQPLTDTNVVDGKSGFLTRPVGGRLPPVRVSARVSTLLREPSQDPGAAEESNIDVWLQASP